MAEVKSVTSILKEISKKFGDNVATIGVEDLTSYGTLSLGSPSIDFCLYNSFPERRIIEFCGAEGSGKTSTAYLTAASFQRKELERNPENPRKILYCDLECGVDPEWAKLMGYDMNTHPVQTIRFMPEDSPAEEIFNYIVDFIKSGEVGLVILDSLNMLVSSQVFDQPFEKKEMGGIAKPLGDFVKRVTSLLIKYNCTLIGIQQLRENIGGYGNPLTTSGGRGWKHGCAVRMMLKKGEFFDADGNTVSTSAESPAGYVMNAAVLKTKVCPWDRKLGTLTINYSSGVDILQDTINTAILLGLIDNSVQGTFKLVNPDTGEIITDESGNEIKIRGKRNIKPYFEQHPLEWHKLYDKVYQVISQRKDSNIVAFEKMLNINLEDAFNFSANAQED